MLIFQIIIVILSFVGVNYLFHEICKEDELNIYTVLCMGGITICGVLMGIFSTLILLQL